MENANFDENTTGRVNGEQELTQSNLDETKQMTPRQDSGEETSLEATQVMRTPKEAGGLDATMPRTIPETQPTLVSHPKQEEPDLGMTVQNSIRLETDEPFNNGETMPTSLNLEQEQTPGFEATIPPPLEAGDSGSGIPILPSGSVTGGKGGGLSVRKIMLIGFFSLILIAGLSAFGGYWSGISARTQAETTAKASRAQEQYDLALQDIQDKNYERARQRFEYVIQLEPNFPGVTDKLAEVLLELSITATPTFAPTPTLTPTPDTRSEDELFKQAGDSLYNKDWSTAIDTALNLRRANPDFKAVQVDGILYVGYRNRGSDKILQQGDLEGGIYDLTLAERFAPLDADGASYQTWARLYILGASFWDVDWSQAVYYFGQVAPALPNLHDGTGWTATQRYRLALIGYGDYLANRKEWCPARQQYEQALSYGADQQVQEAYNHALEKCEGPKQPEATPAPQESAPASPTEEVPAGPDVTPTVPGFSS